jgi:hypothetical protein
MSSPHSSEEEEVGDVEDYDPEAERARASWLEHIFRVYREDYKAPTRKLFRGEPDIRHVESSKNQCGLVLVTVLTYYYSLTEAASKVVYEDSTTRITSFVTEIDFGYSYFPCSASSFVFKPASTTQDPLEVYKKINTVHTLEVRNTETGELISTYEEEEN